MQRNNQPSDSAAGIASTSTFRLGMTTTQIMQRASKNKPSGNNTSYIHGASENAARPGKEPPYRCAKEIIIGDSSATATAVPRMAAISFGEGRCQGPQR